MRLARIARLAGTVAGAGLSIVVSAATPLLEAARPEGPLERVWSSTTSPRIARAARTTPRARRGCRRPRPSRFRMRSWRSTRASSPPRPWSAGTARPTRAGPDGRWTTPWSRPCARRSCGSSSGLHLASAPRACASGSRACTTATPTPQGRSPSTGSTAGLRVSPDEQARFLQRFYAGDLPVAPPHRAAVLSALAQDPGTVENAAGTHRLGVAWLLECDSVPRPARRAQTTARG